MSVRKAVSPHPFGYILLSLLGPEIHGVCGTQASQIGHIIYHQEVGSRARARGNELTTFLLQAPALLATLDPLLPPLTKSLSDLAALIPPTQFYRYSDSFSRSLQSASFIVVFRYFLLKEEVMSKNEVSSVLGSEYLEVEL